MTAGYSGTPLVKKLGIKEGMAVVTVDAPGDYAELVGPLPDGVILDQVELGTLPHGRVSAREVGLGGSKRVATPPNGRVSARNVAPTTPSSQSLGHPSSGRRGASEIDILHLFTNTRDGLFRGVAEAKKLIKQGGVIWVSWYKKAAKRPTEITEDTVREAALPLGLVDVKVCAVDEKWSGLKLVIRKENRQ